MADSDDSIDNFLKREMQFQKLVTSGSDDFQAAYRELSQAFAALDDQLRKLDERPDASVPGYQVSAALRAVMNFSTAMAQVQALAVNDDVVALRGHLQRLFHELSRLADQAEGQAAAPPPENADEAADETES